MSVAGFWAGGFAAPEALAPGAAAAAPGWPDLADGAPPNLPPAADPCVAPAAPEGAAGDSAVPAARPAAAAPGALLDAGL